MRTHYRTPLIHKAFDVLERLSADAQTRQQFEMREKALRDETTLLKESWQKGFQTGQLEGRQEGLQEGLQLGALKNTREMVLSTLTDRFRRVPSPITKSLQTINHLEVLKRLLKSAFQCPDLKAFQATLANLTKA